MPLKVHPNYEKNALFSVTATDDIHFCFIYICATVVKAS